MKKLFQFLLVLALLAGLGAGFGALFMILGGAILTSAGWGVMGTGSLLNIGLVGGAILFPIPLALLFSSLEADDNGRQKQAYVALVQAAAIAGLVGAAVFGMTAGVQLGYVAAAGAIGIYVGLPAFIIGVSVIGLLVAGIYQLSTSGRSSSSNESQLKVVEDINNTYTSPSPPPRRRTSNTGSIPPSSDNYHNSNDQRNFAQNRDDESADERYERIQRALMRPNFDSTMNSELYSSDSLRFYWVGNFNLGGYTSGSDHEPKIEEFIDPSTNRITHG